MKSRILATALLLASTTLAAPSFAAAVSADKFVQKASTSGNFEVESSQLALQKSSNPEIKKFAEEMISDHTKANEELKSKLPAANVAKSNAKKGLDAKGKADFAKLKSAKDFDAEYVKIQEAAHADAVTLFTSYSEEGKNKTLKEFATQTLPTLKSHAEHLKTLKPAS